MSFSRDLRRLNPLVGFMFSQVNGGLGNGYLKRNNFDPTVEALLPVLTADGILRDRYRNLHKIPSLFA
jgi:hypothetical protein